MATGLSLLLPALLLLLPGKGIFPSLGNGLWGCLGPRCWGTALVIPKSRTELCCRERRKIQPRWNLLGPLGKGEGDLWICRRVCRGWRSGCAPKTLTDRRRRFKSSPRFYLLGLNTRRGMKHPEPGVGDAQSHGQNIYWPHTGWALPRDHPKSLNPLGWSCSLQRFP